MKTTIKQRSDDGTYDLFEVGFGNTLDFISNHDSLKEAKIAQEDLTKPMSQADAIKFVKHLKDSLTKNNI